MHIHINFCKLPFPKARGGVTFQIGDSYRRARQMTNWGPLRIEKIQHSADARYFDSGRTNT